MFQKAVLTARLERLRRALAAQNLEGVVMVPGPNLLYYTGVDSLLLERPFTLLVPVDGVAALVVPELEAGPYKESRLPIEVNSWTDSEGPARAIAAAVKTAHLRGKWGVEGKAPFLFLSKLMEAASPEGENAESVLQGLRAVKDEPEVRLLKKSASILSRAFEDFPGLMKAGMTELELAKAATEAIYSKGATKVDDILVQTGASAADPHHLPTSRKLARGEGVVIDVGSTYEGYYADITRVLCLGRSPEVEKVYGKVLEAEEKGIRASRRGVPVGEVDAAARGALKKAGLARYFVHRTGHGLGLEVHEEPYIVEGGRERLKDGMCFTVEPGVYMRGRLGVRIEDNLVIERGQGVTITSTPKEFGWWA